MTCTLFLLASFFLTAEHSAPYAMTGFIAILYTLSFTFDMDRMLNFNQRNEEVAVKVTHLECHSSVAYWYLQPGELTSNSTNFKSTLSSVQLNTVPLSQAELSRYEVPINNSLWTIPCFSYQNRSTKAWIVASRKNELKTVSSTRVHSHVRTLDRT